MNDFSQFLQLCSDMELVALQDEARKTGDKETLSAVLVELGRRLTLRAADPISPEDAAELEDMPLDPDEGKQGGG